MSRRILPRLAALLAALACCAHAAGAAAADWAAYLGDSGATHYSALDQINRANVGRLEVAWTYRTGDAKPNSQIQCNPLIVDGVLYASSAQNKVVALDAATGALKWTFDPFAGTVPVAGRGVNRGLTFWHEGGERRLLYAASHYLHAIDPETGRLIESFGDHGRVDLLDGLDRDVRGLFLVSTTPGVIYRDLIIVPTRVGEGPGPAAPGHICAYDVRTGARRWIFHTIPQPGEFGYDTWPADAWKSVGGANCWGGMAVDEARGTVFVPTGSAAFDFWGGNRVGANLFADCLIALDAATGKRRWHFQFVHHDLWDRDPPAPPVLCEVRRNGRRVAAVAQITKHGYVWVFDRDTGESLFPWKEQPVPASELDGEVASPTQPVPEAPAPFARQRFTEDEATNLSPAAHDAVLAQLRAAVPHVPFSPPSRRGTVILPGFDGGGEWGGAAVDPDGVLYVNSNEMAWLLQMVPTTGETHDLGTSLYAQLCIACHGPERKGNAAANIPSLVDIARRAKPTDIMQLLKTGRGVMPSFAFLTNAQRGALVDFLFGTRSEHREEDAIANDAQRNPETAANLAGAFIPPYTSTGYNRMLDPDGRPALRPPWGTLNAIDLNTGEYRWKRPLGVVPELEARGVPPTGTENYGGVLVTAGGVLFVGATNDERFRAFSTETGEELWSTTLPAGGYATPATYSVGGRQYVVIACGGGKMGTKSGDSYVCFALPSARPGAAAAHPTGPTGRLRVRILDEAGQPTPARAWVEGGGQRWFRPTAPQDCAPYQPDRSFSCPGSFEIDVPAGSALVHIEKGKEFLAVDQPVAVAAGATRDIAVTLRRWVDMASLGYYSADMHVHFGHDDPAVLRQLALADDVNVVPALTFWLRGKETAWDAQWPAWSDKGATTIDATHVVTRTNLEIERIERRGSVGGALGALMIFNLKAPVSTDRFDVRFPANTALAALAKRESPGCVIDGDKPTWPESAVGAALGLFDVIEVCHNHYGRLSTLPGGWGMMGPLTPDEADLGNPDELFRRTNTLYYTWLNCGIRLGVAGGSAMGVMPAPMGFSRTYAKVDGPFTPEKFWDAVRAGRTFATSGPMLALTVDGHGMGASIDRKSADSAPLAVEVTLQSAQPVDAVELIQNGAVLERATPAAGSAGKQEFRWTLPARRSGWVAARAVFRAPDGRLRQAHTSPVYVRIDAKPVAFRPSAEYMLRWMDALIAEAGKPDLFKTAADREATLALYQQARRYYETVRSTAASVWGD